MRTLAVRQFIFGQGHRQNSSIKHWRDRDQSLNSTLLLTGTQLRAISRSYRMLYTSLVSAHCEL
ncbi:hypothetical protein B0O80DRAFT_443245, partial [Mortierella sp. GBAus27b]